jgi:ribosomal protein S12 methylthiotransferase
MAAAERISRAKLKTKVGKTLDVLVDQVRGDGLAIARSKADAPEIDGKVFVTPGHALRPGDLLKVKVDRAEAFDLHATPIDFRLRNAAPPPQGLAQRRMHRVISRR